MFSELCMSLNERQREDVYTLWDKLADFSAARTDDALRHLMKWLTERLEAADVVWVGAARLARGAAARRDALSGWRGLAVRHHNSSPEILTRSLLASRTQESEPAHTTRALVAGAGKLRIHRLHDGFVDMAAMRRTEHYRIIYEEGGIRDRIFVGVPVNADAESFLLVDRYAGARFSAKDAALLQFVMRGLRWFHRELLLAHGLLLAGAPLSPTERRIVRLLLTERGEREIAAELGQSPKTTHKYIAEILAKYGVKGRTGFMARWLSRGG